MKTSVLPLALIALLATATTAAADDPGACVEAASKAQKLRNAHQLVEARAALRICASQGCPAVVQSDCVPWLAEVETVLPGVVVAAKDGSGGDLVDVKVTVDGQPFLTKLDGQSMPIDAGPHTFHFETTDGTTLDRQVVIREADKGQTVAVVLAKAGAASEPPSSGGSSTWKTVGWVTGGVGVAGVLIGAISGGIATAEKGSDCTGTVCNPGTTGGIKSAALVSDIGIIAGAVLVVGGGALVLFGPKGGGPSKAAVRVMPVFTSNAGEMVAAGSF
jgi:hypothetical protein